MDSPTPVAPVVPDDSVWKLASSFLAAGYVAGIARFMKARGKVANEPSDEAIARMEKGMTAQLAKWFPDSQLTPGKEIVVGAIFVAGGMCLNAKDDPNAKKPSPASIGVNGAGTKVQHPPTVAYQAPPVVVVPPMAMTDLPD